MSDPLNYPKLLSLLENCVPKEEWTPEQMKNASEYYTARLLHWFFLAGKASFKLEADVEDHIGKLLGEAVPVINKFISFINVFFESCEPLEVFICRSGLQYVMDDYGNLQTGESQKTLREMFMDTFNRTEELETLDENMTNWVKSPKSSFECYTFPFILDKWITTKQDVPESHVWWEWF